MTLPPQPWMGAIASLLFLGALALLVYLARRWPTGIVRLHPDITAIEPVRARLEPVPDLTPIEPVRVPSPWAIAMAEDLKWIDRQMAMHGVSDLIRVISSYQIAEAQNIVKELHAAKRVIRGEIAS